MTTPVDDKFKTYLTDEPVCPKCGMDFPDAWDLGDYTEVDCGKCGATFLSMRQRSCAYTTKLVTP